MTTRIKHLYLHVPFCRSICYYCDFAHRIFEQKLADRWLQRVKQEIEQECHDGYETIYIGGGTPTALSSVQLDTLLNIIDPFSSNVIEYTVEVNPESLDEEKIRILMKHKVNRISMGIQSSDDDLLRSLNRKHTFEDVRMKIKMLRENGFENISGDLMYSLPGQDLVLLGKTIDDILSLDLEHISLYSLTIEENSVFGKRGVEPLDEDMEADMYEYIEKRLTDAGYIHYEVSNYARKGKESKHNLSYWNYEDFLGISIGASSKIGDRRYTNTRSFERYFINFNDKDEDLVLSKEDREFEHLMMSLRTIYGLDIESFNKLYDTDLLKKYEKGVKNPTVRIENGRLICKDLEILNHVLLDFML
ncbi:MAG: radical SAM family heme chaperone HemW [Erysipelotrichaceae bacterium]|nr:radical SAM family heme chaperone HemW [Erysipelotrichaceae bacterium]